MRAVMGHQMANFLDLGGYFSGVICPNIYLHIYSTSIQVYNKYGNNKYTSRGISGHLCTWNYCSFCVFLVLVWWIVIYPCTRFSRVPHLKCKIRHTWLIMHDCVLHDLAIKDMGLWLRGLSSSRIGSGVIV